MSKRQIILLGDSGVGKTTIFQSFKNNRFTPSEEPTIGVDFFQHTLNDNTEIIIHDTAGQEKFFALSDNYLRNSNIVIIVYNPSSETKHDQIEYWLEQVSEKAYNCYYIFLICNNRTNSSVEKKEEQDKILEVLDKFIENYRYKFFFLSYKFEMNELNEILGYISEVINQISSRTASIFSQEGRQSITLNKPEKSKNKENQDEIYNYFNNIYPEKSKDKKNSNCCK